MKKSIYIFAILSLLAIPFSAIADSSSAATSSATSANASASSFSSNSISASSATAFADSSASSASSSASTSAAASTAVASADDNTVETQVISQTNEDTSNINISESENDGNRHDSQQVATVQNVVQASVSPTVSASTVPTGYCQSEIGKINESTSQIKDQNNRILKLFIVNLILLAIILALTAAVLFKKPRVNISRIPEI